MCSRAGLLLLIIFATVGGSAGTAHADAASSAAQRGAPRTRLDVPAEPLDRALRDLGRQAHVNISYEPSAVAGLIAPAVKGDLRVDRALMLMLSGTGLRAVSIDERTIQIVAVESSASGPTAHDALKPIQQPAPSRDASDLEEITVTGTHIRGTVDTPSPTLVFTRADIDATGANSIQQFLQNLPQNVGGVSENTIAAVTTGGKTNNNVNASSPNLRGLGAEATLVLVNGHRVASGNTDASFVDISMIPLTAVERVEIVTDGASAIYGSDAVGGVVNIILRKHFDGEETRAQVGSVTEGAMHDVQIGQTAGRDWISGSALLTYQYSDQTSLSAASRDYLKNVTSPFALLPEEVQHAAFANFDQHVATDLDLHGDAAYSHRSTYLQSSQTSAFGYQSSAEPSSIDGYGISMGATARLPRDNVLNVEGTYSESDTQTGAFYSPSPALAYLEKVKSAIVSLDANLDGVLAALPAGSVRYALGGQFRRESFGQKFLIPTTEDPFDPRRTVGAAYVEAHVPLVGPRAAGTDQPVLELTLADRDEHYSDFGSSNNPQAGFVWKPLGNFLLRGTYGTSFRAPLLSQLDPIPSEVAPIPGFLLNLPPNDNFLAVEGGNPNLGPEKARVWTFGLELTPGDVPGPAGKLTVYHIDFSNRISDPGTIVNISDLFTDAQFLGPSIVNLHPTAGQLQQLYAAPTLYNPFNLPPSQIHAIYDSRFRNLTFQRTSGLDFSLSYKVNVRDVRIDTGVDGTYVFDFDNQFAAGAPVDLLNTAFNPLKLRMRGHALATRGPLSGGFYLNFANAYTDNNVFPFAHISSWTTVDAVLSYEFQQTAQPLSGSSLALGVINVADRAPPYVSTPLTQGITFDGINASALGRFVSLRLQKRW